MTVEKSIERREFLPKKNTAFRMAKMSQRLEGIASILFFGWGVVIP